MLGDTEKPVAYSYVRFSTAKQELGDSLRRQVDMAEKYCSKSGLSLAEVSYRDLGVSAFKRRNVEKGALASFIGAVESGVIAKGSYLVIEQFDRLSRAETNTALMLLLKLVEADIKVVTLVDEKVWDKTSVRETHNLILAIVYMSRANNESTAKAKRISEAWKQKKRQIAAGDAKRILTSEGPRWLIPNQEKSAFIALQDRVESIQKVFNMRVQGYGVVAIVRRANQEVWPCPGKPPVRQSGEPHEEFLERHKRGATWHTSTVMRLLKNRALLGEYQPKETNEEDERRIPVGDVIKNYYPAVIKEDLFLQAQAVSNRKGPLSGRRDINHNNWLHGILKCQCGASMSRKNKSSITQPNYARYYCLERIRGRTNCLSSKAENLENAVIYAISATAPSYFQDGAANNENKLKIESKRANLIILENSRNRIIEAIKVSKLSIPPLIEELENLENQIKDNKFQINNLEAAQKEFIADPDLVFEKINSLINQKDNVTARVELRENISRVAEKIVVFEDAGYISLYLRGEKIKVNQPIRNNNIVLPGINFFSE